MGRFRVSETRFSYPFVGSVAILSPMNRGKLLLKSFGCQMNKLDSSLVVAALQEAGYDLTDSVRDADVVLINTCSVRGHAEDRVLSNLGHLKHLKKTRPELVVAVIGCMAQRLGPELLKHPAVDLVAGPSQLPQVPDLIARLRGRHDKLLAVTADIRRPVSEAEDQALDTFEQDFDSDENQLPGQAFVRIMRGCNKFCSYCVVPFVRGPEQSRSPAAIVEQARKLADRGIRQVTLLGQTVNSYRHAEGDRTVTLVDLLERISRIDGIHWIRFITSHPKPFDSQIFQAMADNPKVCRYLHIPAQSGSDEILKAMNRGYTCDDYARLIDGARRIVPDIAVAGDFIVGFPGESDQDFEATCELVRRIRYKNCFIFKYSPRPGTRADEKLADSVAEEVKKRRNIALLELQNQISEQENRNFIGQTVEVFVEGPSKNPHLNASETQALPQLVGRTGSDSIVVFPGPANLAGSFLSIRIVKASALTLFGEVAPQS